MNSTNTFSSADVLRPPALHRNDEPDDVPVPRISIPAGSAADAVVSKAVDIVVELFAKQTVRVSDPDAYHSACFDVMHGTGLDAVQSLAREGLLVEAAVAQEVFHRWRSTGIRPHPVTAWARREAKTCAIECAKFVRPLLMQQQSLAM